LAIAAGLLGAAILASALRRLRAGWRWSGVGFKEVALAILVVACTAAVWASAISLFPPPSAHALPWYLAGAGIGLFNLLSVLKFVRLSEAEFLADCPDADAQQSRADEEDSGWTKVLCSAPELRSDSTNDGALGTGADEAPWKRVLRWSYSALFWGVALS